LARIYCAAALLSPPWHNSKQYPFRPKGVQLKEEGAIASQRDFRQSLMAMLGLCFVLLARAPHSFGQHSRPRRHARNHS
jgi:hypothetical protein